MWELCLKLLSLRGPLPSSKPFFWECPPDPPVFSLLVEFSVQLCRVRRSSAQPTAQSDGTKSILALNRARLLSAYFNLPFNLPHFTCFTLSGRYKNPRALFSW